MIAATATEALQPRPFSSIATKILLPYDEAYPGTLRRVLCASPLRRQGVWIALAALHSDTSGMYAARLRSIADPAAWEADPTTETARILLSKRVKDIVSTLFENAEGLLGALAKIGDAPLRDTSYQALINLFSQPEHKDRARVVRQLPKVSASRITVLLKLDAPFILQNLVEMLSVEGVYEFRRTIDLILNLVPEATPDVLAQSIQQLGTNGSLESWTARWIGKAKDLPVALPRLDEVEFTHLRSGEAIRDAAIRYRNCLRRQIPDAVIGRVAYVEYRPASVIIRLIPLSQGLWLADSLHGPHNFRVDPEVARSIWLKLEAGGALIPRHYAEGGYSDGAPVSLSFGVLNGLDLEDVIALDELEAAA